jgi:hypothetical protein
MRRSITVRALGAAAVGLLVVACSSAPGAPAASSAAGSADSPSPSRPAASDSETGTGDGAGAADFCTVLPLDRLSAVVGAPVHVSDSSVVADLAGMGCMWETADKRGGVVVTHSPVMLGFGDIQQRDGQEALSGFPGEATIGRAGFVNDSPDGPFEGTMAAAVVGEGYVTVLVAPPPGDDAVVGLLRDVIATGR